MAGLKLTPAIVDAPISVTLSADQIDWNPANLAMTVLITPSGVDRTITGLSTGANAPVGPSEAGRLVILVNVSGVFNVNLSGEDASSGAVNRFATGTTLFPGNAQAWLYDPTSLRWRRAWSR